VTAAHAAALAWPAPLPEECLFGASSVSRSRSNATKSANSYCEGSSAMPEVHVYFLRGRTLDRKRAVVREIADAALAGSAVPPLVRRRGAATLRLAR
jgi:hypothetical protein